MDNGGISIEQHTEYVQNILNELKNADINGLPAIITSVFIYEKNNSLLLRKELEPLNKELYLAIKEKAVHPLLTAERINAELILLAGLMAKSGFRTPKSSADRNVIQKLSDKFSSIKDESYHSVKTHYAVFLFIAETFKGDGSDTRSSFLERLVDLNVNTFQQNEANFNSFMGLLKNIIDRETALEILKNGVFKGKFWNKDLNVKKSNLLWVVPFLWNTYGFEKEFKDLYPIWLDIFRKAIQKNMTELVFFIHFHLSHIFLNLAHTQGEFKQFNDDVEKPLSEYIKNKVIAEYSINPCDKKLTDTPRKIGFVYDRLINNSPTKLLYSWLEKLTKENHDREYYVYDIEYVEKSASEQHFINLITGLGVKYFSAHKAIKDANKYAYYSHFDKTLILRDKIIQDGIDELIMCNNREQFNLLFTSRTAPLQTYWCHGNFEYDVHGIDKRITHIYGMQENDLPCERFSLVQSDIFFAEEQERAKIAASVIRKRFPENTIVLGSIGRLIKIEGEGYLETVAEIMHQNPDTVYLACGSGGKDNIFKKAKELGIADRFFFEGQIDPQVYAHIIDIYLNTFPNPSGEAVNEYMKLNGGTGVISLSESLAEYIWQAKEQIELHKAYGREAVREMYIYDGKSRRINENSPVIRSIKSETDEIRNRYPAGTIFIGITGDVNLADEQLKELLGALENVVFVYSDEKFELFNEQNSLKVSFRLTANRVGNIRLNMSDYSVSPHMSLLQFIQQCCVPALIPAVRKFLGQVPLNFDKANDYTDELCLTLILAGMYDELKGLIGIYKTKHKNSIKTLFLHNFFITLAGQSVSKSNILPHDMLTGINTTFESFKSIFVFIFRRLENKHLAPQDILVFELIADMMLREYEANNLDKQGKDYLLRTLVYCGNTKTAHNILQQETNSGKMSKETFLTLSVLAVVQGNLQYAKIFLEHACVELSERYALHEFLFIISAKVFLGDFGSAYSFLELLYKSDKDFFSKIYSTNSAIFLGLIFKSLGQNKADEIWLSGIKNDIFGQYRKHLWDQVPICTDPFPAYNFNKISDT